MDNFVIHWALRRRNATLETARNFSIFATPSKMAMNYTLSELWEKYKAKAWEL